METIAKRPVYGTRYVAEQLGMERMELLEMAVSDDCPSVCKLCGAINESGHEPDASAYDCESCGAKGSVNSVLVIAGLI
jgi:uncharacterized protein YbcC (UPF0753/DUF2309 family)